MNTPFPHTKENDMKRYNTFTITRPQYWAGILSVIALAAFTMSTKATDTDAFLALLGGCSIALTVARCRDAGLNGWWCLVILVPILNSFVWIYFGCIRPDDHPKKRNAIEKLELEPDGKLVDRLRIHKQQGFTLFELLITITLMYIFAVIAIPFYNGIHQARVAHAIGDIGEIHMRVQAFDLINRRYPTSLAEINLAGKADPWGNPYAYLSFDNVSGNGPKRKNKNMVPVNTHYDIYSIGPDGDSATPFTSIPGRDDIVMAGDGTFFGEVEDFE